MRDSFFIVIPELATVGQSNKAYLQRYVAFVGWDRVGTCSLYLCFPHFLASYESV
jgi:hypothetical protein